MGRPGFQVGILSLVCGLIFLTNLGACQLWDRDEPRNAGCASEMLQRNNWVVPVFNGELRHQKPVLLYWLMMGCYALLGVSEFSARLPSALLATGTVLMTYGIASRLFGRGVGFLAGIILASNFMFTVAARAATPDAALMFCMTMAIWMYVQFVFKPFDERAVLKIESECFPRSVWKAAAIYGAMGLGVLAKGPIGFVVPSAIIGCFCLFNSKCLAPFRPLKVLQTLAKLQPLIAIAMVLIVAGPWFWLVHLQTDGEFTRKFFVGEHFGRATTAFENHRGGWWFYPLVILVGFFPWSVFWWPVLLDWKWNPGRQLALIWISIIVVLFTIVKTKLPSYVTPCYGALAMLTSSFLVDWVNRKSEVRDVWMKLAFGGLVIGAIGFLAALNFLRTRYLPTELGLLMPAGVLVLGCIAIAWNFRGGSRRWVLNSLAVAAVMSCWFSFGFTTTKIGQLQTSRHLLEPVKSSPETTLVVSYGELESSWVYYGGRPILELSPEPLEETQASSFRLPDSDAASLEPNPRPCPEAVASVYRDLMVITTEEHLAEIKNRLTKDFEVVRTADYLFQNQRLYLLARKAADESESN